jgi:hypothetical protein
MICRVENVFETVHGKFFPLSELHLIETIKVGKMNLEPPQSPWTERLALMKQQQPTTQIVSEMIEVRRDRICPPAKVDTMWKVQLLAKELS